MACKGCEKDGTTTNRYTSPVDAGLPPEPKQGPVQNNYAVTLSEMNKYSFETMMSMRNDIHVSEEAAYRARLSAMSPDLKAFHIVTFVKIANGEEFSDEGFSPKHCVVMLYKLLSFEEMKDSFLRFSALRQQIESKYAQLQEEALVLDLK